MPATASPNYTHLGHYEPFIGKAVTINGDCLVERPKVEIRSPKTEQEAIVNKICTRPFTAKNFVVSLGGSLTNRVKGGKDDRDRKDERTDSAPIKNRAKFTRNLSTSRIINLCWYCFYN